MQGEINSTELNKEQLRAVEILQGPVLILAGAGSGKTRVLTHRMAELISQGLCLPEEILCVTFTNKAAREMESRIYRILSDADIPVHSQLWISTFHSFCVRILREHIELLDYKKGFGIYDTNDQLGTIKRVMENLNIDDKIHPAKNFLARISWAKMLGMGAQEAQKSPTAVGMDAKSLEVFQQYEWALKKANSLDFDDLLLKTYELFLNYPAILEAYQHKFKFLMVDEYQDTNHIQYLLIHQLARGHRNLCVVGDEDQSIYSWRGADIRNILDFEKDFPEAQVVKLEENYRSTGNIIGAATFLIQNNKERKEKKLFTQNPPGSLITVREEINEYEEAKFIVRRIQDMINQGIGDYNDFAIFYRTNAQSRVLEEQLRSYGTPYRIIGGMRFYERMEIKDILSYLRVCVNKSDDIACKRIINVPARGIGKTTLEQIEEICRQQNFSFFQSISHAIEIRHFNAGTTSKLRRFLDLIENLEKQFHVLAPADFYRFTLSETGYLKALELQNSPEARSRIENLEELDNAIVEFCAEREADEANMQNFLEEMALVSDIDSLDDQVDSVTLMTLHVSKGLEFDHVFIAGLEEGLFPSSFGEADAESEIEEERRLAYVGMTRARKNLFLSYAKNRRQWGQEKFNRPSRFIAELPPHLVDLQTQNRGTGSFFNKYGNNSSLTNSNLMNRQSSFNQHHHDEPEIQNFPHYEDGPSAFRKGMKVRHPSFGTGSIFEVEGTGENTKVSVLFSDRSLKKFVVKYAKLEILS